MSDEKSPIEFWFDFLSPFGYLGSVLIERLAADLGREVVWRPTLLGVMVMNVMRLPPLPVTPLKGAYTDYEGKRSYRYFGVTWNPHGDGSLPPLPAARTFAWLNARDPQLAKRFGQALYRAHWSEATDVTTPEKVATFAEERFGLPRDQVIAAIDDPVVKDALKASVSAAVEMGIFGVPTFVVDGQRFWGTERLPMVERLARTGTLEPA